MIVLALALLLDSHVALEQALSRLAAENHTLSVRAIADAEVLREVRAIEPTFTDFREATIRPVLEAVDRLAKEHEGKASKETLAALAVTAMELDYAMRQRSAPTFGREAFHRALTEVVEKRVRRNDAELRDRLDLMRRLHAVTGTSVEELERAEGAAKK